MVLTKEGYEVTEFLQKYFLSKITISKSTNRFSRLKEHVEKFRENLADY